MKKELGYTYQFMEIDGLIKVNPEWTKLRESD